MPRWMKRVVFVIGDMIGVSICIWLAMALRLGDIWPSYRLSSVWYLFLILPPLGFLLFWRLGLYHNFVRQMGREGFNTIVLGSSMLMVAFALLTNFIAPYFIPNVLVAPRSLPFIFFMAELFAVGGLRMGVQLLYFWVDDRLSNRQPAIIYGAGITGVSLAMSLQSSAEFKPVAFIDDDTRLLNTVVRGLKVYSPKRTKEIAAKHNVKNILLAIPSLKRRRRNEILSDLEEYDIQVHTVPSIQELASGQAKVDQLRDLDVKDILARDVVDFVNDAVHEFVFGKCVMVTGAGGSIGSELTRQVVAARPSLIILFEQNELALYRIDQEIRAICATANLDIEIRAVLGSVCDERRLKNVLGDYKPRIVFHAAAYKHVPIVEDNVLEGIRNNVIGTRTIAEVSAKLGVERFILISTDKAVRPTSVMGASKRLAELFCQDMQKCYPDTIFSMVRFGNVLGSSGSVVPLFTEQIRRGGPVTVTDPNVTRYFMTIPEAAKLVIEAGIMANGGDLFILDMGEPIKIVDMARNMIELSGLEVKDKNNPFGDIEIVFGGLRSGEKMYEELLIEDSSTPTAHPKIMRAVEHSLSTDELKKTLSTMNDAIRDYDQDAALACLSKAVENFNRYEIPKL